MAKLPTLVLPNFTNSFDIEKDASSMAIGAILSQEGHPLENMSMNS